MKKYFNIEEIQQAEPLDDEPGNSLTKSGIHVEKFLQLHEFRINSIKELNGRRPQENDMYFLWTVHSFNAFTFIPYIIRECGVILSLIHI